MVSDHVKYDFKPKESSCFLENEKYPRKSKPKLIWLLLILPLIGILISSFVLGLYAFLKIQTCNEEIELLKSEIGKLKHVWGDQDLFDDIKQFEDEDFYPDFTTETRPSQPQLINGGDDLDEDYDINYDDEDEDEEDIADKFHRLLGHEGTDEKLHPITFISDTFSPDHEDITSLMKGGSFTKIGKETQRSKRDVVPSTFDGVPINPETYAEMKKKNKTRSQQDGLRLYDQLRSVGEDAVQSAIPNLESGYQSPAWLNQHQSTHGLTHYEQLDVKNPTPAPVVSHHKSRAMNVEDKSKASRRILKKPQLKSGSQRETVVEQHKEIGGIFHPMPLLRHYYAHQRHADGFAIVRDDQHHRRGGHRQRSNLETLDERTPRRMRALPAIQLSGDTSKYVFGQHNNFQGNGHLRHPDQTYVDWKVDDWVRNLGMDQHFQMNNGHLTVKESGLYFIYAQIFYLDEHDVNGFRVYKNLPTTADVLLQCTTMTHSMNRIQKSNTCYTAGVNYLTEGDQISIRDLADGRYSLFEPGKSFFGVLKLGDVKAK